MLRAFTLRHAALFTLIAAPLHAWAQATPYDMGMGGFEPPTVAKLSDSDATCEELYAEATHLEKQIAAMPKGEDPMALSQKMTDEIMASQQKAVNGARARSMASTVLSMVPGVGGLAAQAVGPSLGSRMGDTQEAMQKHMKAMQESTQASMAVYQVQARQQHVTDLFLDRSCKVSRLDANALAQARAKWSTGAATAATPSNAPAATIATDPAQVEVPGSNGPSDQANGVSPR